MADTDILIVGAGHNALICAGYLAKAGYHVTLLERRAKAGGAVVTEEIIPGYQFDLGGSAHILINHMPVVADLDLTRYGLDYIDVDPLFFAPFPDGQTITMYGDIDRTCESIAAVCPPDADNYRRFIKRWRPFAEATVEAFMLEPSPLNLGRTLGTNTANLPGRFERIADIVHSYGQVLAESFEGPQVPAMIAWMAAQSGPPPTEPLSAPFALWHPMYHVSGMRRPRGGSGMLTQALQKMIEAHGGKVLTDAPVRRIHVEHGRAVGAELANGDIITARVVVSGAHIHTTARLLGDALPPQAARLIQKARPGNGFGMMVRYAMNELPDYTALPTQNATGDEHHRAMQFICPDMGYLHRAYADYLRGEPAREPALIAMTWTAVDPSLAPEGKHVLFLWGQYHPYELASGESWNDIGQREADRMLATFAQYAPNVQDAVVGQLVEHPLYLEETLGLLRGNIMHLEMSVDQMFTLRPALTMGQYRGPIKGLYLTGASTHPGGGIMGASGRNTAQAILHDLSRPRWWPGRHV